MCRGKKRERRKDGRGVRGGEGGRDSIFFFGQEAAYEIRLSLVGSEMCMRDRSIGILRNP